MDTLYVGNIPLDYHYAVFSNGYIDLYNKPQGHDETLTYYRIYTNDNGFYYSQGSQRYSEYQTVYFTDINISDDVIYRKDFDSILLITFIICLFFLFLTNLFTSMIKKGGVLGGLL